MTTANKPKRPLPRLAMAALKRTLPTRLYKRYVGRHEDMSLAVWRKLAASVPASDCILDIGAFIGEYAIAAREANSTCRIVAFEPHAPNASRLKAACTGYRIHIVEAAVAEQAGKIRFTGRGQGGSISASGDEVESISIDSFSADLSERIALIKIDIEGFEGAAFRGAARTLSAMKPVILCEILSDEVGSDVARALPSEYEFWRIDENNGIAKQAAITRTEWRNKNWVLAPLSQSSLITQTGLVI